MHNSIVKLDFLRHIAVLLRECPEQRHEHHERGITMYDKVSTDLKFVEREKKVEQYWKDNDIFRKSIDHRAKGETYTFYDGPPTANGKPHIGHVLTRVIKDMIPRYRTMKGV